MTHTPATRGALVDRLLALANAEVESPAPHMTGDMKFYVYESQLRDLLKEAAAALARPADGWLPIESAPKDGSSVLIFCEGAGVPAVAFFCEEHDLWMSMAGESFARPVYWQPLPAPPIATSPTPPESDTAASVQQGEG